MQPKSTSESDDSSDSDMDTTSKLAPDIRENGVSKSVNTSAVSHKNNTKPEERISSSDDSDNSEEELQTEQSSNCSNAKLDRKLDLSDVKLPTFTDSTKLCLMHIPKTLDVNSLIGSRILLNDKTKISNGGLKYLCFPKHKEKNVGVLTATGNKPSIKKGLVSIDIKVRNKKNKSKSLSVLNESVEYDDKNIDFDPDIKDRHAHLGHGYNKKLMLDEQVYQKLTQTAEEFRKRMRMERKKGKSEKAKEENIENKEAIFDLLDFSKNTSFTSFSSVKCEAEVRKKKRHKKAENEDVSNNANVINSTMVRESLVPSKLDFDISRINLPTPSAILKTKQVDKSSLNADEINPKQKKQKTHKVKQEVTEEVYETPKKKKKKKHVEDETVDTNVANDDSIYEEASNIKKRKKHEQEEEGMSDTTEQVVKKSDKKHKRKKDVKHMEQASVTKKLNSSVSNMVSEFLTRFSSAKH